MSEAYIDGMNLVFCGCRVLTVKSTLAYSMDGLDKPFPKGMTCCDYVRFVALKIVVCLLSHVECVRLLLNWGVRRTLFSAKTMGSIAESCEEDPIVAVCPATGHRASHLLRRRRGGEPECPGRSALREVNLLQKGGKVDAGAQPKRCRGRLPLEPCALHCLF